MIKRDTLYKVACKSFLSTKWETDWKKKITSPSLLLKLPLADESKLLQIFSPLIIEWSLTSLQKITIKQKRQPGYLNFESIHFFLNIILAKDAIQSSPLSSHPTSDCVEKVNLTYIFYKFYIMHHLGKTCFCKYQFPLF